MKYAFKISVTSNEANGDILAVYIQFRKGKAVDVKEFGDGAAFANYGKKGELLGIEMLQPCKLSVLDQIPKTDAASKKFIRNAVPPSMLACA